MGRVVYSFLLFVASDLLLDVDSPVLLKGDDTGRDEDIARNDPLPFTKYQVNCKNSKTEGKFVGRWSRKGQGFFRWKNV